MSMYKSNSKLNRRKTDVVAVGDVAIGSGHPVVVQSMTNTPTADIQQTVAQIVSLVAAGSELVRITVNDFEAMAAIPDIVKRLSELGCGVPLIGDFHYNGHVLLEKYPKSAQLLAKYRINPGNVGKGHAHHNNFETMIRFAKELKKPVRIGVNWGSLDQDLLTRLMDKNARRKHPKQVKEVVYEAMVTSAIDHAHYAQELGLAKDALVLSVKMSDLQDMVHVYQSLAKKCDYVLHLGLTEAGGGVKGLVASAAALGILLQQGIGDTIRVSLTPEPGASRDMEVKACTHLLQSLGMRYFMPAVTSCPGCGRTNSDRFVQLAKEVGAYIEQKMPVWKSLYPGVESLSVAVMGCVVNGPGESKHADIGISLPGSAEDPSIPVYIDGNLAKILKGDGVKENFLMMLDTYIHNRFSKR